MCEEININVNETNETINIVSTEIVEVIDVNVGEIVEEVTFNITEEIIQVNINKVTGGGGGNQDLQSVTDNGNVTTNDIKVENANYFSIVQPSDIGTENKTTGAYAYIGADGVLGLNNGEIESTLKNTNVINSVTLEFPDKPTGIYTVATTEDISTQVNSDWNATSGVEEILNKPTIPTNTSDLTNDSNFVSDADYTHTDNNFTDTLKTKLDVIADGAEVNVNADWNATSGDAQILNKPTIPSISGLELQANKQNSLATDGTGVKYPTVDAVNSGLSSVNTNSIRKDTVKLSEAINKGQAVYVSGANGTNILVSKASNASEATSSKTIGLLETTGAINAIVNVVTDGLLTGLDTSTATIGDPVWLGVNGNLIYGLTNKPYAPAHLVYIGVVTRVNVNNGEILIKVQNGFELKEIHDVAITSVADKQLLSYDSATSLWKNKSVTTADIATSTNKNYVTDAQATIIGNTSGTNTGDQDLSNLVVKNTAITGATKTKITYDAKGLVTAGADATTADIADSTNKRYVTDANLTTIGNQSGTNTGDETTATIKTKLGAANTSTDGYLTSANWNTFNNKLNGYLYKSSYPTATVTGTTSEVQVLQLTIPANTFSANDLLNFTSNFQKVGVIGTIGIRVKISTSATMPSGTTGQIAVVTIGTASLYSNFERTLMMLSGGNIYSITNTTSAITDTGTNINAITSQTFDTTVTNYLYVSVTNSSSLDSTSLRGFKFSNI